MLTGAPFGSQHWTVIAPHKRRDKKEKERQQAVKPGGQGAKE